MWIKTQSGDWLNLKLQKGVCVASQIGDGATVFAGDAMNGGVTISTHLASDEAEKKRDDIMAKMQSGVEFYGAD